jgi:hypothetical protein
VAKNISRWLHAGFQNNTSSDVALISTSRRLKKYIMCVSLISFQTIHHAGFQKNKHHADL